MPIKTLFQAAFLASISILPVYAQVSATMNNHLEISIPAGFSKQSQRTVIADNEALVLTRYVRDDRRNLDLGGEHFSTLYTPTGKLKGFVNITYDLVGKPLPDKEASERVARNFLQQYAPDLLSGLELHWIAAHDESIRIHHRGKAETVTLTGMKVKMRNKHDGLWFWVILGGDGQVMIFERDIYWISFPGKRRTEKWLHDSFLAKGK